MTTDPLDEFRATLADPLARQLNIPTSEVEQALAAVTEDWAAKRKRYPNSDQHPLEDDRHGHRVAVTLPFVPESDAERAEREARLAAYLWALDASQLEWDDWDGADQLGPPPKWVGVYRLLDQCHWWRARIERNQLPTEPVRLADMTHGHRLSLLNWLRKRAKQYKNHADWVIAGGPHPSGDAACDAFEAACDEQFAQLAEDWLEQQPLVRALVWWTTPYAESPLTWQPMDDATPHYGYIVAKLKDTGREVAVSFRPSQGWWDVATDDEDYTLYDTSELTGWRELRGDEHCPHGIPNIISEITRQRIVYCMWCDHGHESSQAEEDNCERCCEMERMDH